jgi:hypothetical protein
VRKATLVSLFLLLAPAAAAAEMNLLWDDCGPNGGSNRDFACNTNLGSDRLVGSFVAPPGLGALAGWQAEVSVFFGWEGIPAWWTFGAAPNCRATASMTSAFPGSVPGTCGMYFAERGAQGAHLPDVNPQFPGTLRVRLLAAIQASLAGPVEQGEEVYLFTLTIDHQRTIGPSACSGCNEPANLGLDRVHLYQASDLADIVIGADFMNDLWTRWKRGLTVPASNPTWGQIKTLYR